MTLSDLSVSVLIAASAVVSLVAWRIALCTKRNLGTGTQDSGRERMDNVAIYSHLNK